MPQGLPEPQPEEMRSGRHDLVTYAEDLPIVRRYWRTAVGRQLTTRAAVTVPGTTDGAVPR